MYIYRLSYDERHKICFILDQSEKWLELGSKHMGYDPMDMEKLKYISKQGKSASEELLSMWENLNHTVLELFILFSRMKLNSCLKILKNYVDPKYHVLIEEKEDNLADILTNNNSSNTNHQNLDTIDKISRQKKLEFSTTDNNVQNGNVGLLNPNNFHENRVILKPNSPVMMSTRPYTVSSNSVAESAVGTPQIPYSELEKSTNNWDEKMLLGKGGFGKVYKGMWKYTNVAIKRLEIETKDKNEQIRQTLKELYCLNCYRHDNILPLYGYSMDHIYPCLVYQYMSGGSLDSRLHTKNSQKILNWPTRLKIAIGSARGIQFLHTSLLNGKPLIHGDIKSANILLDPSDNPRIGDFGLAREGPQSANTHVMVSKICGTPPYLPPDFLRSQKLSTKVDTYSFGIVLFELATAMRAVDKNEPKFLKDKVISYRGDILELKDNKAGLEGDIYFLRLIDVGKICVNLLPKLRPEMVSVLTSLEEIST